MISLLSLLVAATVAAAPATKPAAKPATKSTASKSAAASKPAAQPSYPVATPEQLANTIRALEELGGYRPAAEQLRQLRPRVKPDADLDLWLAINLARAGWPDSAALILQSPLLTAALRDTADSRRFHIYGWGHEQQFLDGRYDGWYWYVARARAEVAATRGRWAEALEASRLCTAARPLSGVEWYLRAMFAGRAGQFDEAAEAVARARRLTPILPEARYLFGLYEWRAGRRMAAQKEFRAAMDLDSSYRAPALAILRARLPVPADTLPEVLFHGLREAALLTSTVQPKYDDFDQMDTPAVLAQQDSVTLPDSLASRMKPFKMHAIVLVDARGRAVMHEDPWTAAGSLPEDLVGMISQSLLNWRLTPAVKMGRPAPLWLQLEVPVVLPESAGRATR